ncbi:MAG: polyketide cyclase, partial [Bacteroidetes bacterium]
GKFKTVMAAKDKSSAFDFTGIYTNVKNHELIEYDMDDGRHVKVEFATVPEGSKVTETFEAETTHSVELQRSGWQAILDNFKKYAESNT